MEFYENQNNTFVVSGDERKLLSIFSKNLFATMLATIIGIFLGTLIPFKMTGVFSIIGLILCIVIGFKARGKDGISMVYAHAFGLIEGVALSAAMRAYVGLIGLETVILVFIGVTVYSGVLMLKGYTTKKDLSSLGGVLFAGLIGILVLSLINIFIGGETLALIISIISTVLFSVYTMYDMNRLKSAINRGHVTHKNHLTRYVIDVYLDIINLILDVLRIVAIFSGDD